MILNSYAIKKLKFRTILYALLHIVQLVIFVSIIFCCLGSSDDFVGLYFRGVPPLIT